MKGRRLPLWGAKASRQPGASGSINNNVSSENSSSSESAQNTTDNVNIARPSTPPPFLSSPGYPDNNSGKNDSNSRVARHTRRKVEQEPSKLSRSSRNVKTTECANKSKSGANPAKRNESATPNKYHTNSLIGTTNEKVNVNKSGGSSLSPNLQALSKGKIVTVQVIIGGHHYSPAGTLKRDKGGQLVLQDSSDLGQDGNKFYCHVCNGFGEIVCCDGCPLAYHPTCIPEKDASRISLDRDDDPWYCPECITGTNNTASVASAAPKKNDSTQAAATTNARRSSQHRCVDCQATRQDLSLVPCTVCGNYVHFPSCHDVYGYIGEGEKNALCATCRAVDELTNEEDGIRKAKEVSEKEAERFASPLPYRDDPLHEEDDDDALDDDIEDDPYDNGDAAVISGKRKAGQFENDKNESGKKSKKKKKKKMRTSSKENDAGSFAATNDQTTSTSNSNAFDGDPSSSFLPRNAGLAQAIPAFYFYLAENRWKIERALSRSHRCFNRLPKGSERNELVAQEAASWWAKLREADHRRYINMSMRDFENRIIEWKEEKNLREMGLSDEHYEPEEEIPIDTSEEDTRLTYQRHERLFLSTSVGSKPFKPEPDQSYNRVLLDLLHDNRFHPLPMLGVSRPDEVMCFDGNNAKVAISHFDVHGPIATSVGDECLGCTRGWAHFCSVIKRRIPAVEHRARLQPPLSSLLATRVGLGLRPQLERVEEPAIPTSEAQGELFEWRDSNERRELNNLPVLLSSSLDHASQRADDIALFLEETMAMKASEPERPPKPGSGTKKIAMARDLPMQKHKSELLTEEVDLYRCGRCRTIIHSDTGCVQCRRAQLVINTAKRPPQGSDKHDKQGLLKVQTTMLGRVQAKDGSSDTQFDCQQALNNSVLNERWSPHTVLAPKKMYIPGSRNTSRKHSNHCGYDEHDFAEGAENDYAPVTTDISNREVDNDQDSRPEGVRPRRAVKDTPSSTSDIIEEPDRDDIARENKKKADELYRKTLSTAFCSIVHALERRDPLGLFAAPVIVEGYSEVIKKPMDLSRIRANVLEDKYTSMGAFISDVKLMCDNAVTFNAPDSIYSRTANEMSDLLYVMQKRASDWQSAIMDAQSRSYIREENRKRKIADASESSAESGTNALSTLRDRWPAAVEMLENGDWLRRQLQSDFTRTKENEITYYGCLAIRRAAAAADASLAPYTDSFGPYNVVAKRNHLEDEALRKIIDDRVSVLTGPVQLSDVSTCREESIVRLLRKVQLRRLDRRSSSRSGCVRCDDLKTTLKAAGASNLNFAHIGTFKKIGEGDVARVDPSRMELTTGLGSLKLSQKIKQHREMSKDKEVPCRDLENIQVSVRSSKIHGLGLFSDQPFQKGDSVVEYVGEWVDESIADEREKQYQEKRFQAYILRLDEKVAIDATLKGGSARYLNHNCSPNCSMKVLPAADPKKPHLKRFVIVALRDIEINEEITYDYQLPLELNLNDRIPCNCQSEVCRGFMNWDIPEKDSRNSSLLVQKRGANMRDRIRRLERPLKRDES